MKVLTIVNSLGMGGIEKTLLSCLNNFGDKKIKMSILCFQSGGELERDFKNLGVEVKYIKKTGSILADMVQLFFVLIFSRYDVVHSRFGFTSGGIVLGARLAMTKVIVSLHNTDPSTLITQGDKKLLYAVLCMHLKIHKFLTKIFATKIIGHSKANLDKNYPNWEAHDKFEVLYNGVDFDELDRGSKTNSILDSFIREGDFVILHIGSFREQKNHLTLIDCFNSLLPKINNLKLILVGNGGLEGRIKKKVQELDLSQYVFFAGFDQDINKYFVKSNLFFFPSFNEGLANVLIEAQYKGIPICVSKLAPLYESGFRDYHKYYFDPLNKDEVLYNLTQIINDIKNDALGNTILEARNYVIDKFSIGKMVSELEKVYME
jgi:glycosyltransferase involved in cell wall biosynthesis